MAALPKVRISPEEYLALDRAAEIRSEYIDGDMVAMAGGSEDHNLIAFNLAAILHALLRRRPCKAYLADTRVRVSPTRYLYPDAVVVCGEAQFEGARRETLLNPTLVIEVLSESTEVFDMGRKFELYRALPSLQEYVLIAQDRTYVERRLRQPHDEWLLTIRNRLDESLPLVSIDGVLPLADLYEKVTLPVEPAED